MTSLAYMTYAFVFVFLSVVHPSEENCLDQLNELEKLKYLSGNLMVHDDPRVQMVCTLQNDCKHGNGITKACHLLSDCYNVTENDKMWKECTPLTSQKVHLFHIMCLISNFADSGACHYRNLSNVSGIRCSVSNPTTTQMTTTTTPTATTTTAAAAAMSLTSEPKSPPLRHNTTSQDANVSNQTTTQMTTTTTTAAAMSLTSEPKSPPLRHNTTSQDPNVSDPTTTQTTKTRPEMTATTAMSSSSERARQNITFQDVVILQNLLWLSLVFHVIVPVAVYFFMRRQWRRDKAAYMSHGKTLENEQMIELDASQAFVNSNRQTAELLQLVRYSDDDVEEDAQLSEYDTRL